MRILSFLVAYVFLSAISGPFPATAMPSEEEEQGKVLTARPTLYLQWLSPDGKGDIPKDLFKQTIPAWQEKNPDLNVVLLCDQGDSLPNTSPSIKTLPLETLLKTTWALCFPEKPEDYSALSTRFHALPIYVRCDLSRLMLGVVHKALDPNSSILFYADQSFDPHDIRALQKQYFNILEKIGILMANGACINTPAKINTKADYMSVFCEDGFENGAMMLNASNARCQEHLKAFLQATMRGFSCLPVDSLKSLDPQIVYRRLPLFLYNLVTEKDPGTEKNLEKIIPVTLYTALNYMQVYHPLTLKPSEKHRAEAIEEETRKLAQHQKKTRENFVSWLKKNTNNWTLRFPVMQDVFPTRPSRFTERGIVIEKIEK